MKKGGNTKINFRPFMGESFYFFTQQLKLWRRKNYEKIII